jgi:hypothetical protein
MAQPKTALFRHEDRRRINSIRLGPALPFDAPFLLVRKFDQEIPAARRAALAAPILNRGRLNAIGLHAICKIIVAAVYDRRILPWKIP